MNPPAASSVPAYAANRAIPAATCQPVSSGESLADHERERAVDRMAVGGHDAPRDDVRAVAEVVGQPHRDDLTIGLRIVLVHTLTVGVEHPHSTELE